MWFYNVLPDGLWELSLLLVIYLATMIAVVQIKKDRSISNFTWGGGCMLIAIYYYFVFPFIEKMITPASDRALLMPQRGIFLQPFFNRSFLLALLIIVWASRLSIYVYRRYNGQDPRYLTWKQTGIKAFIINCIYIFGPQAVLMIIMSVPIIGVIAPAGINPLTYLDFIGLAVWLVGFYFEAVSDNQLFNFTRNPENKGHVMRYGLWRFSRHPNYFGEVVMWWGIFLIAFGSMGILAIVAPITITLLLLFVTGIPWVEQAMDSNPEYQEYKKHTSIFFPWFPK